MVLANTANNSINIISASVELPKGPEFYKNRTVVCRELKDENI